MSDLVPNDNANPEPAPTETVTLEHLPSWEKAAADAGIERGENWPVPGMTPEEFAREADKPKSDERLVQQMGHALEAQRERQGLSRDETSIIEVRAPRERENYKDVRELSRETTFNRRLGVANQLTQAGYDDVTAQAIAMRDGDLPPTMAPLATDRGEPIPELGTKLTGDDQTFDNVYSATRALRNGRAAVEAARQQLETEWQQQLGQYQQQAPEVEVVQTAAPQPAQTQQPTEAQRQEAERLAAERFQLAHQAAALQMTNEERALVAKDQEWDQWLERTPEAKDWNAWEFTRQNHPQRAAALVREFGRAQQAKNAIAHRRGELNEIRAHRSQQWNHYQAAERAKLNAAWDVEFDRRLAAEMPEFSTGKALRVLQVAASDELKSRGMTDAQIDHEWKYGALRSPEAQMLVARAAKLRLMEQRARDMQEKARERRARVPQPQAPGVWIPAGADHSEDIARLERRLANESERKALFTAAELTKLRRQAGQL